MRFYKSKNKINDKIFLSFSCNFLDKYFKKDKIFIKIDIFFLEKFSKFYSTFCILKILNINLKIIKVFFQDLSVF